MKIVRYLLPALSLLMCLGKGYAQPVGTCSPGTPTTFPGCYPHYATPQQTDGVQIFHGGTSGLAGINELFTNRIITGGTLTSPIITSGTLTSPAITGGTLTSPAITGSTLTSPTSTDGTFTTPTITSGVLTGGTIDNATLGATTPTTASLTRVNSDPASGQLQIATGTAADSRSLNWLWGRMRTTGTITGAEAVADGQGAANKLIHTDAATAITMLNHGALYVLESITGGTSASNTAARNAIHSRVALVGQLGPTPTIGPAVTNAIAVGHLSTMYATATQGGVGGWTAGNNPAVGYFRGSIFGGNDNVWTASGASNYFHLIGREFDVSIQGTSNVFSRFGVLVASFASARQADGLDDVGIGIISQTTDSKNFKNGIQFGATTAPVDITGALIKVISRVYPSPATPAFTDGIDISGGTFSGNAWKSPGFTVGGTGNLGFYSAAPVAKPTGVAVSAAGIHAALVTLGLIAP